MPFILRYCGYFISLACSILLAMLGTELDSMELWVVALLIGFGTMYLFWDRVLRDLR